MLRIAKIRYGNRVYVSAHPGSAQLTQPIFFDIYDIPDTTLRLKCNMQFKRGFTFSDMLSGLPLTSE